MYMQYHSNRTTITHTCIQTGVPTGYVENPKLTFRLIRPAAKTLLVTML